MADHMGVFADKRNANMWVGEVENSRSYRRKALVRAARKGKNCLLKNKYAGANESEVGSADAPSKP